MKTANLITIIALISFANCDVSKQFGYVEPYVLPNNWSQLPGFSACGGNMQSPINILDKEAKFDENLKKLVITKSSNEISSSIEKWTATNNNFKGYKQYLNFIDRR
jgi:carbonic anhydrase